MNRLTSLFLVLLVVGLSAFTPEPNVAPDNPNNIIDEYQNNVETSDGTVIVILDPYMGINVYSYTRAVKEDNCGGACGAWVAVWNGYERTCIYGCPLWCTVIVQYKGSISAPNPRCPFTD